MSASQVTLLKLGLKSLKRTVQNRKKHLYSAACSVKKSGAKLLLEQPSLVRHQEVLVCHITGVAKVYRKAEQGTKW